MHVSTPEICWRKYVFRANYMNKNWNLIVKQVVSPIGQTNSLLPPHHHHHSLKNKKENVLQVCPGDHLPSISILEAFYIGLISLGVLSVLIHFSIYNCIIPALTAFVELQKGCFLCYWPACQIQTYDPAAK